MDTEISCASKPLKEVLDGGWLSCGQCLKVHLVLTVGNPCFSPLEFADPPPLILPVVASNEREEKEEAPVVPLSDPPKTLIQWAVLILNTPDPILKVRSFHKVEAKVLV
jgi:hypothetical protein